MKHLINRTIPASEAPTELQEFLSQTDIIDLEDCKIKKIKGADEH